jgi:FtsH-binding integral membrane protein
VRVANDTIFWWFEASLILAILDLHSKIARMIERRIAADINELLTFFIAAAMFAAMSLYGYTTGRFIRASAHSCSWA